MSSFGEYLRKLEQDRIAYEAKQEAEFAPTDAEVKQWLETPVKSGKYAGQTFAQLYETKPAMLKFMCGPERREQQLMYLYVTKQIAAINAAAGALP